MFMLVVVLVDCVDELPSVDLPHGVASDQMGKDSCGGGGTGDDPGVVASRVPAKQRAKQRLQLCLPRKLLRDGAKTRQSKRIRMNVEWWMMMRRW